MRNSLRMALISPILIPAVGLGGMWAYVANDSVQDGIVLRAEASAGAESGKAVHTLLNRLQDERLRTAAWQGSRSAENRGELKKARKRTDAAAERLDSGASRLDETVTAGQRAALDKALGALSKQRNQIDLRAADTADAYRYYSDTADDATTLLTRALESDDGELAHRATALTALTHLTEQLSREDALLTGARPTGYLTTSTRQAFLGHVAAQRQAAATLNTGDLPASAAAAYRELQTGSQWTVVQHVEDTLGTDEGRVQSSNLPGTPSRWRLSGATDDWSAATGEVTAKLRGTASDSLDGIAAQGADRAQQAMLLTAGGTVAVLLVLAASGWLAFRTSRSVAGRLGTLHSTTLDWTREDFRRLVDAYKKGDRESGAVAAAPAPVDPGADDELGQLIGAVRDQQRTAVTELHDLARTIDAHWEAKAQATAENARKREGAESVVLGLLRRNQLLISQLISLIDGLERREHDPELLAEIFKIDHLVTRLRRDLENQSLIVGVQPGRRWSQPVPVFQVLRSAVAETVDYTRVEVEAAPDFSLSGRVVADVGHILAALIENGTSFSPPHTNVNVRAEEVAGGRLAVEVIDRGLGMDAEHYDHLNRLLADPPEPDVTRLGEIPQLGLFVVALLAQRIGLEITLCKSAYGGTKAVVLIPNELLEEAPVVPDSPESVKDLLADRYGQNASTHVEKPPPAEAAPAETASAEIPPAPPEAPAAREPAADVPRPRRESDTVFPVRHAVPEPLPQRTPGAAPGRPGPGTKPEPSADPAWDPFGERTRQPLAEPAPTADPEAAPAPAPAPSPAPPSEPKPAVRPRHPGFRSQPVSVPTPAYTDVAALDPADDLGGYPSYTGGGLLTRPKTLTATEALTATTALADPSTIPDSEVSPRMPAHADDQVSHQGPEPAQTKYQPPQKSAELKQPMTLPTRKPGENLAAPLRRPPGQQGSPTPGSSADGGSSPWPTPSRAGAIAGAVQRAGRQARTEPDGSAASDAQGNGVSPEDA